MGFFDFLKPKQNVRPTASAGIAFVPWVHRRTHLEILRRTRETEEQRFRIFPLGTTYGWTPARETPRGPVPLSHGDLAKLGIGERDAVVRCLQGVGNASWNVADAHGLAMSRSERGIAPAQLLLFGAGFQLPLAGRPIGIPVSENLVFVAGEDDAAAFERIAGLAEAEFARSENYLSLQPLVFDGQLWHDWKPAAGHPCEARCKELVSASRVREAKELAPAYLPSHPGSSLAHLAPIPASEGGGVVAAWVTDTSVLLPRCDRIVLLDAPGRPEPRVEVRFDTFLEVMPAAVEEVEDTVAPFWRARFGNFPTVRELRFMRERDRIAPIAPAEPPAASPDELLAAWNAGDLVLVREVDQKTIALELPDRRRATVPISAIEPGLAQQPEEDQLRFELGRATMLLLENGPSDPEAVLVMAALKARVHAWRATLPALVPELTDMQGEPIAPTQLYPVIRPPGYAEASDASMRGMVKQGVKVVVPERVSEPFGDRHLVEYVADLGASSLTLTKANLPEEQLPAVRAMARLNLEAASLARPRPGPAAGTYRAPWMDGYAASRLLTPAAVSGLAVQGELLAFAVTVGHVWFAGTDDEAGMAAVLGAIEEAMHGGEMVTPYAWREILGAVPWVLRDGAFQPWDVPPAHPLAARIAELDGKLAQRRASSGGKAESFSRAVGYVTTPA